MRSPPPASGGHDDAGAGRRFLHRLRRLAYWLLPVVLLAFIFRRLDLAALRARLAGADGPLLAASLLLAPVGALLGAWRWRFLMQRYLGSAPPYGFVAREYFISSAVGALIPASVGRDAYRIGIMGRRDGRYVRHLAVILAEKVSALPVQTLLALALLPWMRPLMSGAPPASRALLQGTLAVMLGCGLAPLAFLFLQRLRGVAALWVRTEGRLRRLLHRLRSAPGTPDPAAGPALMPADLARPLLAPAPVLTLTGFTLLIQALNACATLLAFAAVGHPVPFQVNLFLMPVMFFAFSLPVSVGGVGVREGVFIVLYGLFGVPREAALLVSFTNGLATLLIHALGALMLVRRPAANPRGQP